MQTLDDEDDRHEVVSSSTYCYENGLNNFFSFKTFANGVYWSHSTGCGEYFVFYDIKLKRHCDFIHHIGILFNYNNNNETIFNFSFSNFHEFNDMSKL